MDVPLYAGELVVETQTYSLHQVCAICGVQADRVVELVSFGIIEPEGSQPDMWQFKESAVHRAKKALRLHRDLGLDQQGLALTLELLDEIDRLRMIVARMQG
jgi:chaperone modulatory protein CbpM